MLGCRLVTFYLVARGQGCFGNAGLLAGKACGSIRGCAFRFDECVRETVTGGCGIGVRCRLLWLARCKAAAPEHQPPSYACPRAFIRSLFCPLSGLLCYGPQLGPYRSRCCSPGWLRSMGRRMSWFTSPRSPNMERCRNIHQRPKRRCCPACKQRRVTTHVVELGWS